MKIKRVLVVDNNATIVELVGGFLEKAGYEVLKAYDGINALDLLEAEKELPDVIFLDLVMPKIDGQRLTRFLKLDERYSEIPIVILTGIAAEEDGKLLSFGADAYIAKGKIEETFGHIQETLKWIEDRPAETEKKKEVLGSDKLFPREMTKELLLIKQHFDSMFHIMQEGVIEIDEDHRVLFANPSASRTTSSSASRSRGSSRTARASPPISTACPGVPVRATSRCSSPAASTSREPSPHPFSSTRSISGELSSSRTSRPSSSGSGL